MTREQAVAFVNRFNSLLPYLPPINAQSVTECDAMKMLLKIANGELICAVAPPPPSTQVSEQPNQS